ncbi:MAG: TonB-dependent receptor [Vicinamibacterales bacterium]
MLNRSLVLLAGLVLLPTAVFAQASISGTAKDASGAVLPGVTVEAASPVLIEKVRSVVTDGSGRYQIVDLRPGAYTVTFTLPGFNTFKRDGIELTGSIAVSVDAELRVGSLEETITVTGETPTVDVQNTTKQRVITSDIIDSIPTGRSFATLGVLVPGIVSSGNDVGGSLGDPQASVSSHGGRSNDQRIMQGGLPINDLQTAGAGQSGAVPNVGAAAEVSLDFGALSAEQATGGVSINFIPRDGGNSIKGSVFLGGSNEDLAGSNFTQRLKDRGLTAVDSIKKNWDFNPGFGGPIKRDKLWFYTTFRYEGAKNYAAGISPNVNAFKPDVWTYEAAKNADGTPVKTYGLVTDLEDAQVRVTYQATQKDKFSFSFANNMHCRCPFQIGALVSPEAANDRRFPQQRTLIAEWKSPVTNRVLVEATAFHKTLRWGTMHLRPSAGGGSLDEDVFEGITPAQIAIYPSLIGVTEQSTGLNYHGPGTSGNGVLGAFNNTYVPNYTYRVAVSYVTGSHNFKTGIQDSFGYQQATTYANDIPYRYRFLNGVPNQITQWATPWTVRNEQNHDLGIFAQDKWTIDRMTLTGAVRFDYYKSGYPEQKLGPAQLLPNRNLTFAAEPNLDWKDVSFRSGWAYDVGGNGKTAIRASLNKYLAGQALGGFGSNTNPILRLTNTTTRNWTDANGDFVPQCDLASTVANGECGAMANSAFGTALAGQVRDLELRTGTGHRGFNYEFSMAVQREIIPRVSADVSYFRRWYGNFAVTDDLNRVASDYDTYSITVPSDSRLPGGGGNTITGLYDLKPQFFGQPSNTSVRLSKNYGTQIEHWNGVDVGVQARLTNGLMVQGGTSTGRTTTDNCEIIAQLPEMTVGGGAASSSTAFCHIETPWLTQLKGMSAYTIPKIDVQVAATFQSGPGNALTAAYIVPSAVAAQSLGRPLAGNAPNVTVNLIPAVGQTNNNPVPVVGGGGANNSTLYGERLNQIDVRIGKLFRFGQRRASVNLDLYNVTNSDTVTATNNNYATLWRPTGILQARFIRFSTQLDF